MVMMVVVIVMMMRGCERRAGKYHKQKYGGKKFLHAKNVTRSRRQR
jgi:hypothetical protein